MNQNDQHWDTELYELDQAYWDWDKAHCQRAHDWHMELYKRDMEIYKLVSEHYRQDLREFWSRSSLYILSQAFLFSAFATLVSQSRVVDKQVLPVHLHDVFFEILVTIIGVGFSLAGSLVAKASTKWIHSWRNEMLYLDATKKIDRFHCYSKVEMSDANPQNAIDRAKKELEPKPTAAIDHPGGGC